MRILQDPDTGELVEALPSDLASLEPYDYREAKAAVMAQSRERRGVELAYEKAIRTKAAAERAYRKVLAVETLKAKAEHGATMAETVAKGTDSVGEAKEFATVAEGQVYACLERLRLCSEDRASLHRLIEWSQSRERTNS